jgi:hypothetical protein
MKNAAIFWPRSFFFNATPRRTWGDDHPHHGAVLTKAGATIQNQFPFNAPLV